MTDRESHEAALDDSEEIRFLLKMAGKRPELPAGDLAAIAGVARAAWEAQWTAPPARELSIESPQIAPRLRSPMVPRLAWGLAAALVATVGLVSWWMATRGNGPSTATARVEKVRGGAIVEVPAAAGLTTAVRKAITGEQAVEVGSLVTTAAAGSAPTEDPGGVALRLAGGASVRLDAGTTIRLVSARRVELEAGAVYVDSGGAAGDSQVEIVTPFGLVTEIGTQFSVRRSPVDPVLEVRVREGEVNVRRDGDSTSATAGVELLLGANGEVNRRKIAPHGAEWAWVLDRAPDFDIEGRTLGEFLGWVGRETGWTIEFSRSAIGRASSATVLHGSIAGLRPDRAAFVVLSGADLSGEVVDGTLKVEPTETPDR